MNIQASKHARGNRRTLEVLKSVQQHCRKPVCSIFLCPPVAGAAGIISQGCYVLSVASTKSYVPEKYNRNWQWSCQQKCKDYEYVGMEEGEMIRISE